MKQLLLFITFFIGLSLGFGQESKIDSLKIALDQSNTQKSKLFILDSLNSLLISGTSLNDALPYFTEMADISKSLNNYELETKAYKYISEAYIKKMDSSKAFYFAKKALDINKNRNNLNGYLLDINQLGRAYHHFQLYEKAIETYNKGIIEYNENGGENKLTVLSTIYSNLSAAYDKTGQTDNSIKAILKGVEIAEKTNAPTQKSYSLYLLGYKYMGIDNYKKAEEYFLKSLKFSDSVSLQTYVNMNHHGLGINYSRWGIYDKALHHNKIALDFFRKQNDKLYEFDVLNNIAIVYQKINRYDSVVKYGELALKIAKEINHKLAISGANLTLSNAYLNLKQYNKAEIILLEIAKDTITPNIIDNNSKSAIFSNLSEVYEGKNNYKKSLEYHKKFKKISDSINKQNLDSKFSDIETKYQTEKKEKENLQLKADNTEQALLTQKANARNWILGLGILLLSVSAFFIWRRYKAEAKAKQIISDQKDEIEQQKNMVEILQKELHHRMKNNLSFIDLFINLAKGRFEDKAYQNKLNELQNRMRSMFEVHKQLFKKDDVTSVQAKNYIDTLVENVKQAYEKNTVTITNTTSENEMLLANTSFPVGLIVNEFVTNSYKYAFEDQKEGTIYIALTSQDNIYKLVLKDNGKGLPKDFDINELDSFGLETIQLLTKEYGGTFTIDGANGVAMNITLPKTAA
ncbi:MAG: histidine kinase dimerization/phosphoacceptor domain -containing protein [Xanthomarina gelatinilytica]|uniref:tetratricopeptide repeat-containing sensor histidine kinase n=1 Tax=Xanthomarina gelatinilytica TaxID=1137281 RepID=UPI003A83951C